MRKLKNIAIIGVLTLVLAMTSCQKWIAPEVNIDPDRPTSVDLSLILPAVEVNAAYVLGGFDVAGVTGIWMQYIKGTDRQARAIDVYNITQTDVNNLWNDIYTGPLMDLKDIKEQAVEKNLEGYTAVANVLEAYILGTMTGLFGDLPVSQAFQATPGNPNPPAYDSEEEIYAYINTLLDTAIAIIDRNPIPLTGEDLIYGGDYALWQEAAYTLKARYALRTENRVAPNWDDVIAMLDNGFTSLDDDMKVGFTDNTTENNPLYQFVDQREGYIADNGTLAAIANIDLNSDGTADDDPRLAVLNINGYWFQPSSDVTMMGYTEALFIRAEAMYNRGDADADVQTALVNAVTASLDKYGTNDAAWLALYTAYVGTLTSTDLYNEILRQKYIDNMMNPEAWADYRRTGQPALTPTSGSSLPERFPYPTDEVSYNPNTPDYGSVFNPLWFTNK